MTAYAYYRGLTEVLLGGIRGIGACFGVAATFVFPVLVSRLGVVRTGLVSIVTQVRLQRRWCQRLLLWFLDFRTLHQCAYLFSTV